MSWHVDNIVIILQVYQHAQVEATESLPVTDEHNTPPRKRKRKHRYVNIALLSALSF